MNASQRGIVLVMVLWVLVLLVTVVSAISSTVHTASSLTHNQLDQSRLRALADAAFYFGAARAFDPDPAFSWEHDGRTHDWQFNGHQAQIRVFNPNLHVDLNQASKAELKQLLVDVAVDEEQQQSVIDAILDWRDGDTLHRLNGAEDEQYQQAGKPYGAKDAPFSTVDEIGLVLGMTPDIKTRISPYLSVSTGSKNNKFTVMEFGLGGGFAQHTVELYVEIPDRKKRFRAKALVSQLKGRFKLVAVDYAVPAALWPEFDEEEE
ncbi:MAG: type II secretion system protein GspK [Candidatus Thiodiazotropha sp.]